MRSCSRLKNFFNTTKKAFPALLGCRFANRITRRFYKSIRNGREGGIKIHIAAIKRRTTTVETQNFASLQTKQTKHFFNSANQFFHHHQPSQNHNNQLSTKNRPKAAVSHWQCRLLSLAYHTANIQTILISSK